MVQVRLSLFIPRREFTVEPTKTNVMGRLVGRDKASIDDRGRIQISRSKLSALGENPMMVLGEMSQVVVFSDDGWEKWYGEFADLPIANPDRDHYLRLVLADAESDLKADAQGRIVVPTKIREKARLRGELVIFGMIEKLEIWSLEEFERYTEEGETYGGRRRIEMRQAYEGLRSAVSLHRQTNQDAGQQLLKVLMGGVASPSISR